MNPATKNRPWQRKMAGRVSLLIASLTVGCLGACEGGGGSDGVSAITPPGQAGPLTLTVPFPPAPESDAFYQQPNPMCNVSPGTILISRPVTFGGVDKRHRVDMTPGVNRNRFSRSTPWLEQIS